MKKILSFNVLAAMAAFAAPEELIRNGSFEEIKDGKAVGWPSARHYTYADRAGMNGTRGVAYDNTTEKDYRALLTQDVPFKHGQRYRFSVWQKAENATRPVSICVEWFKGDCGYITGTYCLGSAFTHDWTKL